MEPFIFHFIEKLDIHCFSNRNKTSQCEQRKGLEPHETIISCCLPTTLALAFGIPCVKMKISLCVAAERSSPCSQVGQQTTVEVSKLVCQIIEIHQWESEKLGESRSTDCNDPVYRGRGDSPRWYFQQQDLMEGREGEKREETCFCLAYVYCMVIDSYEHETRDKNSGHVVVSTLTKIKRVLSASRYRRDATSGEIIIAS